VTRLARAPRSDRRSDDLSATVRALEARVEALEAGRAAAPPGFDYCLFEQRFRGSTADIRQRQAGYLDLFRGRRSVVDLGCGRGEFVELLSENGVGATGVDANEGMVAHCRAQGLPVVRADVFEYLAGVADAGLDGVFAAQLVEHLPPEAVLRLCALCAAKLRPGGIFVAETINSDCPPALNWFYLDPTHVRPVPPRLLTFMVEQSGLTLVGLRFVSPVPESGAADLLDAGPAYPPDAGRYQDYAVVACKP
jgi:O-antigen chain-terminating methyltransferase